MIEINGVRYRWTVWSTVRRLGRKLWRRTLCELTGHRQEYEDFATKERCCFWCGWNTQGLARRRVQRDE